MSLRPASDFEKAFSVSLHRKNMAVYRDARGIEWDVQRSDASWVAFENLLIIVDARHAGVLRLLQVDNLLEIRDLQLLPSMQGRGIGAWAIEQTRLLALARGLSALRLRVYAENPARNLYRRMGFHEMAEDDGVIHMLCPLSA